MRAGVATFLFASDFHGSTLCFKRFIDQGVERRVNALIVGGDLTGKYPTPIVQRENQWEAEVAGIRRLAKSDQEYQQLRSDIENVGSYAQLVSDYDYDRTQVSTASRDAFLSKESEIRLRNWLAYADSRLQRSGIQLFLMGGNDDPRTLDQTIAEFPFVVNPDVGIAQLQQHYVIGESSAVETDLWTCPRDVSEEELTIRLQKKIADIPSDALHSAIFIFHCPPKDSPLDQAHALDSEGRTVTSGGQPLCTAAGSSAVRTAIKTNQPVVSLHGHIHESDGMFKIGRTLCFNPGSDYGRGVLRAWYVALSDDSVADYKLIVV